MTSSDSISSLSTGTDSPHIKNLTNEKQVLTNELILLNRELSRLKQEHRSSLDSAKKSEKENHEHKKSISAKDTALEKIRTERDELWSIVNTDKYKNVRAIE
jgi:dynactin complex subunit